MAENSRIEWTDHTFNPWIGCTKVSPACDHCYAEALAGRYGWAKWGGGEPRKRTAASTWKQPLKWNREAEATGVRKRVFCASLADVFDNAVPPEWRADLFELIRRCQSLDWLLLTKRIGNAEDMLPTDWGDGWPNVWLGATVVTQAEADRDIPKLLRVPATIRFLSMEPLLGPVNLYQVSPANPGHYLALLDWIIVGGETGRSPREMQETWARSLRDQCSKAGVPFFLKQMTRKAPIPPHLLVRQFPPPLPVPLHAG